MDRARRRAAALLAALAVGIATNVALATSVAYLSAMRRSIEASFPDTPGFGRTAVAFADLARLISVGTGAVAVGALVLVVMGLWRRWRWARIGALVTALVGVYAGGYTLLSYLVAPVDLVVPLPAFIWLPQSTGVFASELAVGLAMGACVVIVATLMRSRVDS